MSNFSIGDAVGSGFGLISRRPLSVLAWAVVFLILVELPRMAHLAEIQPAVTTLINELKDHFADGGPPDFSAFRGFSANLFHPSAWLGLSMLGRLAASAILTAAVYRAVLEPEAKSFASLRVGVQELWLVLLNIVIFIVLFIAALVISIVASLLVGLVAAATLAMSQPAHGLLLGLLAIVIVIGAIVAFLAICVRLSLAGPLTFKERQFRLFESWAVTKGHGWKLFGLAFLMILVLIGLGIVLGVLELAVGGAVRGAVGFNPLRMREMLVSGDGWRPSPWLAVVLIIKAIVSACFMTIFVAPWATAFRELGGGAKPEHPAVF